MKWFKKRKEDKLQLEEQRIERERKLRELKRKEEIIIKQEEEDRQWHNLFSYSESVATWGYKE